MQGRKAAETALQPLVERQDKRRGRTPEPGSGDTLAIHWRYISDEMIRVLPRLPPMQWTPAETRDPTDL